MSVRIRVGNAIRNAIDAISNKMQQRNDGLIVPPDYIKGRHFGGFEGYTPWIQDCIRAACSSAKGVGLDELSEITAVAIWQPPAVASQPGIVEVSFHKHGDAIEKMQQFGARVAELTGRQDGIGAKLIEQLRGVQNSRQLGTLMVVSLNPFLAEQKGELPACVSAWNPASIEEAKAVPKQQYLYG